MSSMQNNLKNNIAIEIEDKNRNLLHILLMLLPVAAFAWLGYCVLYENRVPASLASISLLLGAYITYKTSKKSLRIASILLLLSLIISNVIITITHPHLMRIEFGLVILIVANVLLGSHAGLFICFLVWFTRTLGAQIGTGIYAWSWHTLDALVLYIAVWGMTLLADIPMHDAISSALDGWMYARNALAETRERRAELARSMRALEEATYRIERANNELLIARWEAERARASKAQFASHVSHEIRGPLNLILGFSRMMALYPEKYADPLPASYHADVDAIYRNSEHLAALVDDVLDLSQIETDHFTLIEEYANIEADVVLQVLESVRPLADRKGLYLRQETHSKLPEIMVDAARLRQALLNIVINAIRFTDRGGITVTVAQKDHSAIISVQDTGSGISPKDMPRLFEEFSQIGHKDTREESGSGLGLSISKRLVELHGGKIWAESEQRVGTTFYFSLPLEDAERASATIATAAQPKRRRAPRDLCLVLHNDASLIRALGRQMERYRLIGVQSGAEVLALTEELHPRAIIASSSLAYNIWTQIADASYDVPVISCGVSSGRESDRLGGVLAYLVKPILPEALIAVTRRIPQGDITALLVDDDPDALRLLEDMLTLTVHPYRILRAYEGEQALDVMTQIVPDIVFLDLVMPGMNGEQLLDNMRADKRLQDVPVVIVSAKDAIEAQTIHMESPICLFSRTALSPTSGAKCLNAMLEAVMPRYLPEVERL